MHEPMRGLGLDRSRGDGSLLDGGDGRCGAVGEVVVGTKGDSGQHRASRNRPWRF